MLKYIGNIFLSLLQSFDNKPSGFSARKLSAFVSVMICWYITMRFTSTEVLVEVVSVWLIFALLCLGIITIEQIIRLKGKDGGTKSNTEQQSTQSEGSI